MSEDIIIRGATTNNLKGIDIKIKKNAINLIIGPSGSGKSSLAYDTVAQIGINELGSMYDDGIKEPEYSVESYSNMLVTVPISQINKNNNVRSTIGTYFALNPCLAKLFSSLLNLPYDFFVLNKSDNVCSNCYGIGYTKQLDSTKLIDYEKTLSQVPIRCWNRNKDFYRSIIEHYCEEIGINSNKQFRDLSNHEKKLILFGESSQKYMIRYKTANRTATRTTHYYGVMTEKPMLKNFSPSSIFYSELPCEKCNGQKFDEKHRKIKICGYSIGEAMLLPFAELSTWISEIRSRYDCKNVEFSLNQIEAFSKKAVELNLGYLFLNRNIPSLSGGELQRLRLIKVFSTQLSDLLIILDEPLAGLSMHEKNLVYQNIKRLEKKHTLLIVDHHALFVKDASNIIALGSGSGAKGGNLINAANYLKKQTVNYPMEVLPVDALLTVSIRSKVYGYKGVEILFAKSRMNVVFGTSGIGKSTLLREYLPQCFEKYSYINQKPLSGNARSTVATDLGIQKKLTDMFSKAFKLDKSLFSNITSADGACRVCGGTGFISYGSEQQSQIKLKCKECRGTGFDKKITKYKILEKSLIDIYEMTIDEAILFLKQAETKHLESLYDAHKLLLGHLKLGEKTSELSGGENIRVKLLKTLSSSDEIIGIDEPFKGLNNEEIYKIVLLLNELVNKGKTIIVVDHEENSFKYFSRIIELSNEEGILLGNPI